MMLLTKMEETMAMAEAAAVQAAAVQAAHLLLLL